MYFDICSIFIIIVTIAMIDIYKFMPECHRSFYICIAWLIAMLSFSTAGWDIIIAASSQIIILGRTYYKFLSIQKMVHENNLFAMVAKM